MSTAQERLESALLETGMMNERFVEMIRDGEVDSEFVKAALENFRKAVNPEPIPVKHRYVLGLLFSEDASRVLLVWKNRPAWQNGKLNGIGGKIEPGETPLQAMDREFVEETYFVGYANLATDEIEKPYWQYVGRRSREAIVEGQDESYEMFVFAATIPDVRHVLLLEDVLAGPNGYNLVFELPMKVDPNREEIIALPLNREILTRRGVPGLAWVVDISLQAIRENFTFEVQDPPMYPEDDE